MRNAILIATVGLTVAPFGTPTLREAGLTGNDVVVVDTSRRAASMQTIINPRAGHAAFAYL